MIEILMSDDMVCAFPILVIIPTMFFIGIVGTIWNRIDRNRRNRKWRTRSRPWWEGGRRR